MCKVSGIIFHLICKRSLEQQKVPRLQKQSMIVLVSSPLGASVILDLWPWLKWLWRLLKTLLRESKVGALDDSLDLQQFECRNKRGVEDAILTLLVSLRPPHTVKWSCWPSWWSVLPFNYCGLMMISAILNTRRYPVVTWCIHIFYHVFVPQSMCLCLSVFSPLGQ